MSARGCWRSKSPNQPHLRAEFEVGVGGRTADAGLKTLMDNLLRGRRVFVVEDDALIVMLYEDMLQGFGAESIERAATLSDAQTIARATAADVALLDVRLGREASYPVAEVLKARGIPFLFVTAYAPHMGDGSGRDAITLMKPFTREELAHAIRVVLDAHPMEAPKPGH